MSNKINKRNIENVFALSPLQEGMLFHYLSEKETKSRLYFEQLTLGISGNLNIEHFKKAWNLVVEQNAMLRAVFKLENVKQPVQIILKNHDIDFQYYDLSKTLSDLSKIKLADIEKGFDLQVVPFRVTLFKIEDNKYEIILSFHHIILDGWSMGIILNEFCECYSSLLNNKQIVFKSKADYYEYIKYLNGQDKDNVFNYWQKYLIDAEECNFSIKKRRVNELSDIKKKYNSKKFSINKYEELNLLSVRLNITKATVINFLVFLGIFSHKAFPTRAHRIYATEKETIQIQVHKLSKITFAYKILFPNKSTIRF